MGWFSRRNAYRAPAKAGGGLFSTHGNVSARAKAFLRAGPFANFEPPKPTVRMADGIGMDGCDDSTGGFVKPIWNQGYYGISDSQAAWYVSQGFIGYQFCAILSQHWLIYKACNMPAKDAVRKGWDLTVNGGKELTPDMNDFLRKLDKRMRIKWQLQEFITKGKIFGIRCAMFIVKSDDPLYYEKPFNIDGVQPGAYKGISQIDPYWITPELITSNLVDPSDLHFYEPEFWRINGKLIHRTHLVIFTTGVVPDVLKPSYLYGGVSIPQQIYERVYASERTANEAPMLTMTKRLTVMSTDLTEALANEDAFTERMQWWQQTRDNYGIKINGLEDKLEQFDLTLTDLDAVIMTQYQIVAAIAKVPGTKLLGTQPKGFNSTGEFEESSYHEELESIQENDLSPLLDRHYLLAEKSYLQPKFNSDGVNIEVNWAELDAMTAQEQANVNAAKAATGLTLIQAGAIDSQDELDRLRADKDSGYSGLKPTVPPMPDNPGDPSLAPLPGAGAKLPAPRQHAEAGS